jgi:putative oxidoreductase
MDIALLGLRLVVGLTFAVHGARTLFGAFGGAGIEGTARFSEQIDLRPGKPNAWLSGVAELFAGLLLALGLVMPVAAAALIGDMTAAVLTVHLRNGFFNTDNGFEYNLVLAVAVFALAGVGAGAWSLDEALDINLAGTGWALAALGAGVLGGLGAVVSARLASRPRRAESHAPWPPSGSPSPTPSPRSGHGQ